MNRRFAVLAISILLVSAAVEVTASSLPIDEMERHIKLIRKFRMSIGAREQLHETAFVALGWSTFLFHKEGVTGRYCETTSSTDALPPLDSEAKYAQYKKIMHTLHPFVDTDSSGFVTTPEATEFYKLVSFGYKVRSALEYEGPEVEKVAVALELTATELLNRIRKYNDMVRRAEAADILGFKTVPIQ